MYYPALRIFYAAGLSAIAAGRFDNLRSLMEVPTNRQDFNDERPLVLAVYSTSIIDKDVLNTALAQRYMFPVSEYLFGFSETWCG